MIYHHRAAGLPAVCGKSEKGSRGPELEARRMIESGQLSGGYNLANPVYHRHRHPSVSGFTFSIPFNCEQARAKAVHHCVYNNDLT